MDDTICEELTHALHRKQEAHPRAKGYEECLAAGGDWVHLRLCLTCGHVGCCDSSPRKHATAHFHATAHPVIRSFEPGESWEYCYDHDQMIDGTPAFPAEIAKHHYSAPYL